MHIETIYVLEGDEIQPVWYDEARLTVDLPEPVARVLWQLYDNRAEDHGTPCQAQGHTDPAKGTGWYLADDEYNGRIGWQDTVLIDNGEIVYPVCGDCHAHLVSTSVLARIDAALEVWRD